MAQHKLVIAEKPSVAQSLAAVIGATVRKDGYLEGNGWRVSWCVGHLAGLADADSYDPKYAKWRYDDLPILPEHWQMVVGKDKKKQFDILKKLMNAPDVTEVVNACDAGREGEMIFRSVYELADCQKPMKRLWISSMEDSAIREGFANLRPGADYDGLRDAALCRAKADWLVGINATRLFSVLYLDWLKSHDISIDRSNYDLIYTAPLRESGTVPEQLEKLYQQFNLEKPVDFHSPSMSVSDIVAIRQDGKVSCHYCDSVGFTQIPGFLPENPLKNAEMALEDDYGMIDGIINNGAKEPTVAELEQQARSGQPISLMELAAATHREEREKKKSVMEQLKGQPKTEHKKTAPKKSAEREI